MGSMTSLTASDGFKLGAYRADPQGKPKGGLVVIQEIFGVNHHIRAVCDRFAALGYASVAPAIFDRYEPNFESGYSPAEIEVARAYITKADFGKILADTQAAIDSVQSTGKVGIVGYCLGGSVAFMAACKLNGLACAIGYYGGMIAKNAEQKPKVPTMLHFGETDHSIPMTDVEIVKQLPKTVGELEHELAGVKSLPSVDQASMLIASDSDASVGVMRNWLKEK